MNYLSGSNQDRLLVENGAIDAVSGSLFGLGSESLVAQNTVYGDSPMRDTPAPKPRPGGGSAVILCAPGIPCTKPITPVQAAPDLRTPEQAMSPWEARKFQFSEDARIAEAQGLQAAIQRQKEQDARVAALFNSKMVQQAKREAAQAALIANIQGQPSRTTVDTTKGAGPKPYPYEHGILAPLSTEPFISKTESTMVVGRKFHTEVPVQRISSQDLQAIQMKEALLREKADWANQLKAAKRIAASEDENIQLLEREMREIGERTVAQRKEQQDAARRGVVRPIQPDPYHRRSLEEVQQEFNEAWDRKKAQTKLIAKLSQRKAAFEEDVAQDLRNTGRKLGAQLKEVIVEKFEAMFGSAQPSPYGPQTQAALRPGQVRSLQQKENALQQAISKIKAALNR